MELRIGVLASAGTDGCQPFDPAIRAGCAAGTQTDLNNDSVFGSRVFQQDPTVPEPASIALVAAECSRS
jgi:hypothetical protein